MKNADLREPLYSLRYSLVAVLSYFVLTFFGMLFYPGGTIIHADARRYSFFENYFSDLGRHLTHGGESNLVSALLFSVSLLLVAVAIVVFFVSAPGRIEPEKGKTRLSLLARVSGIAAGTACGGVAVTPWDLFYIPHITCVYLFSVAFLAGIVFISIIMFRNRSYPRWYPRLTLAYGLLLSIYLAILFSAPDQQSPDGVIILAVSQKIIVYTGLLCLLMQISGVLRYVKKKPSDRE